MEDTKPKWQSKLNWTGLFSFIIGAMAMWGVIPEDQVEQITSATLMIFGALVPVLRTFFTSKRLE